MAPKEFDLRVGMKVRIVAGYFMGLSGKITSLSHEQVGVAVKVFGRITADDFPLNYVVPYDSSLGGCVPPSHIASEFKKSAIDYDWWVEIEVGGKPFPNDVVSTTAAWRCKGGRIEQKTSYLLLTDVINTFCDRTVAWATLENDRESSLKALFSDLDELDFWNEKFDDEIITGSDLLIIQVVRSKRFHAIKRQRSRQSRRFFDLAYRSMELAGLFAILSKKR